MGDNKPCGWGDIALAVIVALVWVAAILLLTLTTPPSSDIFSWKWGWIAFACFFGHGIAVFWATARLFEKGLSMPEFKEAEANAKDKEELYTFKYRARVGYPFVTSLTSTLVGFAIVVAAHDNKTNTDVFIGVTMLLIVLGLSLSYIIMVGRADWQYIYTTVIPHHRKAAAAKTGGRRVTCHYVN